MTSENTDIAMNGSPQERFKQMVEEVISKALWDFGLRQNDFDFERNGFRKKAIQKDAFYKFKAKTDFLGHDKVILESIKLLPRATNDFKVPTNFLIIENTIDGFDQPEKIEALVKAFLVSCKSFIENESKNTSNYNLNKLSGVNKLIDPKKFCISRVDWDLLSTYFVSTTNAHTIKSIPENAYDIVEGHLRDAIRKYFGVEVAASYDVTAQTAKFSAAIDEDAAKEKFHAEKNALAGAKSHQFQKLVIYGMSAAEEFRAVAQEIGEWQSKRIAELPPSIKQSMRMCDAMRDYKSLSSDERAQVASQMVREIGSLQKSIKTDIGAISKDCDTTEEASEILAAHRRNMQRYAGAFKSEETSLSALFGSAAVDEKSVELAQIVTHTGIQVAQQSAVHQSYNVATLQQISKLSGKMDELTGSVSRLSIAIKLRDMVKEGGIVGDIANETLGNTGLYKKDINEFSDMGIDDLDDIIEAEAVYIKQSVEPVAKEALVIEQKMIEGKPAGQILLPHYDDEDDVIAIAAE